VQVSCLCQRRAGGAKQRRRFQVTFQWQGSPRRELGGTPNCEGCRVLAGVSVEREGQSRGAEFKSLFSVRVPLPASREVLLIVKGAGPLLASESSGGRGRGQGRSAFESPFSVRDPLPRAVRFS